FIVLRRFQGFLELPLTDAETDLEMPAAIVEFEPSHGVAPDIRKYAAVNPRTIHATSLQSLRCPPVAPRRRFFGYRKAKRDHTHLPQALPLKMNARGGS